MYSEQLKYMRLVKNITSLMIKTFCSLMIKFLSLYLLIFYLYGLCFFQVLLTFLKKY